MARARIKVIFTGGTIAMGADPKTGGAVPLLSGEDLMNGIPGLDCIAAVDCLDFCNKPGPHIRPEEVLELAGLITGIFDRDEADGVVITHGTDTLEESAYELDLLLGCDRPVVVTGAMRTGSAIGADGPANLMNAVLTAADGAARGKGVLVVFNNEIHLARDVTKASATQLNAFRSPLFGPVGLIYGRSVQFCRAGGLRESIRVKEISAQVELVRFTLGMGTLLLDAVRDSAADGLVVEGAGVGHVSVEVARAVGSVVAAGKPVVLKIGRAHV